MVRLEIVVIGASAGGLSALQFLLQSLPGNFSLPVAVVHHRSPETPDGLAELLQHHCCLPVSEPEDKETIMPGHVYLAPADYHLLVDDGCFWLSTDEPVRHARPSIDLLFESAADAYRPGTLGVVLTGASEDGAQGAASIKKVGGLVVVQDPASAESPVMPQAAINACAVDLILPLSEIASFLVQLMSSDGDHTSGRTGQGPARAV